MNCYIKYRVVSYMLYPQLQTLAPSYQFTFEIMHAAVSVSYSYTYIYIAICDWIYENRPYRHKK